jgi:small GTP-binding protein
MYQEIKPNDYSIKIITMGNANSGKSSLIETFCRKQYLKTYEPTIGVEFQSMVFKDNDINYKLMFWDTAGQEVFASIIKSYYKNIAGIFYVLDLSDRTSIRNFDYWLNEYNNNKTCDAKILVVGNKIDKNRVVSKKEINNLIRQRKLDYIEISIKTGENVEESLNILLKNILTNFDKENHPGIFNLKEKNETMLLFKKERECQESCCSIC